MTSKISRRSATADGGEQWVETTDDGQVKRTRRVVAGAWLEARYNCYCCSCNSDGDHFITNDPACRNHGYAGKRPCELHGTPGTPWGAETEGTAIFGTMPMSVQAFTKQRDESREARTDV